MSKHTPGPWEWDGKVWEYDVENESPWLMQAPVTAIGSKRILSGSIKCDSESNARLIAAAPELLEALQVLSDEADSFNVDGVYFNEKCMGHKGLDMAIAAIAKATGEAQ